MTTCFIPQILSCHRTTDVFTQTKPKTVVKSCGTLWCSSWTPNPWTRSFNGTPMTTVRRSHTCAALSPGGGGGGGGDYGGGGREEGGGGGGGSGGGGDDGGGPLVHVAGVVCG
jgi:hypothetical protein